MPGLGAILALFDAIIRFFTRAPKEPVDKVVDGFTDLADGFSELTEGQQALIGNLQARLLDLEQSHKELIACMRVRRKRSKKQEVKLNVLAKEVADCNEHRTKLQGEFNELSEKVEKEKLYSHGHAHLVDNYMKYLEADLETHGILPDAREAILKLQRDREEARDREQRRLLGLQ